MDYLALTAALALLSTGAQPETLETARRKLEAKISGTPAASVGSISLAGFEFYRELDVGNQTHVLLIAGNPYSGLLVFRPDGTLLASEPIDQPTWVTVFDIDSDGQPEVITEEISERGTGVLAKEFRIYRVGPTGVERLWSGESYYRSARWSDRQQRFVLTERRNFIRLDDQEVRYVRNIPGRPVESVLRISGGKLQAVTR